MSQRGWYLPMSNTNLATVFTSHQNFVYQDEMHRVSYGLDPAHTKSGSVESNIIGRSQVNYILGVSIKNACTLGEGGG